MSTFGAGTRLALGQVKVDSHSNETTAMPALLELLDLKGMTVTADAMHTQRASAETTTAKGGE